LVAMEDDGTVSEVPGGVAGWVARVGRGNGPVAAAAAAPVPARAAPATKRPTTKSRPGATGGDEVPVGRLMRDAEKNMARLQRQRDRVEEALTVAVDHQDMTRLGRELAEVQSALDEAEEAWLALALEAEEGP
jgi:hypothetical protein